MTSARQPLISGNWKMHHNHFEALQLVQKLSYLLTKEDFEAVDVSVHPPFTDLRTVQTYLISEKEPIPIALGAQHCHHEEKGAFTGEVSPAFLAKLDVRYVIAGHSERFKALISHAGVFDLHSMYFTTEELWFPEWEFKGTPWSNPSLYRELSPSHYVDRFKTPTLVIHGALDFRVPDAQA